MALEPGSYAIFPHVGAVGSTLGVASCAGNSTVLFPPTGDRQIWKILHSSNDAYTISQGEAYATNVGGKLFVVPQATPSDWFITLHPPGYSIKDGSGNSWVVQGQDWIQVDVGSPNTTNNAVFNLGPVIG